MRANEHFVLFFFFVSFVKRKKKHAVGVKDESIYHRRVCATSRTFQWTNHSRICRAICCIRVRPMNKIYNKMLAKKVVFCGPPSHRMERDILWQRRGVAASNDIQTMMITTKSSTIITDRLCERVKEHHEKFQLRYMTLNRFYVLFLPPGTAVRMVEEENSHWNESYIEKWNFLWKFGWNQNSFRKLQFKLCPEKKKLKFKFPFFLSFSVLLSLSLSGLQAFENNGYSDFDYEDMHTTNAELYHDENDSGYQEPHEVISTLNRAHNTRHLMVSSPTRIEHPNIPPLNQLVHSHRSGSSSSSSAQTMSRKATLSRRTTETLNYYGQGSNM